MTTAAGGTGVTGENASVSDVIAFAAAVLTAVGLLSQFVTVIDLGNQTRNRIVGIGGDPVDDIELVKMLRVDWLTFWLGSSCVAGFFGLAFVVLAWWFGRPLGIGVVPRGVIGLVGLLFLGAGIAHGFIGGTGDLREINKRLQHLESSDTTTQSG